MEGIEKYNTTHISHIRLTKNQVENHLNMKKAQVKAKA